MTDKAKAFWKGVLSVLAAIGSLGIALLFLTRRKPSPSPADVIVAGADAEKAKIASEIHADSDQALLDKFNASVKKGGTP